MCDVLAVRLVPESTARDSHKWDSLLQNRDPPSPWVLDAMRYGINELPVSLVHELLERLSYPCLAE